MSTKDDELNPLTEYFERVRERCCESDELARRCSVWRLVRSADRHLERFHAAARRHERARQLNNQNIVWAERDIMQALLYETADTVYMVLHILNPDVFDVRPSLDGAGVSGVDAMFIEETLNRLEAISAKVLQGAAEYRLTIDFQRAVDEIEGVTYTQHCHWRDFIPGSLEASFFTYFCEVQRAISERLMQVSRLWHRSVQQLLLKPKRPALAATVRALLTASFEDKGVRTEYQHHLDYVRRHVPPFTLAPGNDQELYRVE